MKPTITYEEILKIKRDRHIGFVDVRSPGEYQHSTIPGAHNIPILDNQARETVGILYAERKFNEAKRFAIEWTSARLPAMYDQYQKLCQEYDELVLFCSRGGMRSNTIFSLLKAIGMPVSRMESGFKGYRRYVVEHLDEQLSKVHFVTLYGLSGSGKTEILKELADQGQKVLDIEACANHRGSLLGGIGLSQPHSQKMFEALLFDISRDWQTGDIIFTEGESKRVGNVILPKKLFSAIQKDTKIFIDASLEYRVNQIHKDYIQDNDLIELTKTIEGLKHVINPERVQEFQKQLGANQTNAVIEKLLTSYYDPKYSYQKKEYQKTFTNLNCRQTAEKIIDWLTFERNS
ncbi:tRNA 2-selenouridine(34) synthase MnmH [Enterococcus florum]|uniref:tRNA 2-selenouridine(34) synthase MnmH n=1 Tax=Enterococcus florum TaxID=2480627 RepID=A0A4P5P8S7_9ENTE|nr:tRNA 2-selenouridine(34) synthase MnmH [Enterococcus florum]GCF94455.1 tRNA 2-selenouridine(34) synthase MnmH [Enterococcus florum]